MEINIRQADIKDLDQIRFLFRDTVKFVNSKDYTQQEIKVWEECYKNTDIWTKNILNQHFLVATINNTIVGFSSITDSGYLDFMYVHKDFQRRGVARKLLTEIEKRADKLLVKRIFSHVSKTAHSFFEKHCYTKAGEQVNRVNGIEFVNSIMEKTK